MQGSAAAIRSSMAQVPSVEQSSKMISSRSRFSGSGAASTCPIHRSITVRSLYAGIKIESFMLIYQYNRGMDVTVQIPEELGAAV